MTRRATEPEFVVRRTALTGLALVQAHTRRCFARHTHDTHGIGLIDAGGQHSASGRGAVQAVRGQLITVNPGEVHDGWPMQGEKRRWRMLNIESSLLKEEYSALEWTHPVFDDGRMARLFDALFASAVCGDAALALEQHLAVLLHHAPITSKLGAELGRPNGPGAALVRAREQLADGAQPPPSLAELAREAGLSRYQFLRAFSARFGLPPAAWAGQQRLARAERQLACGMALADAAAASGFADQSHMTRAFRRFRGYTPGQFATAR